MSLQDQIISLEVELLLWTAERRPGREPARRRPARRDLVVKDLKRGVDLEAAFWRIQQRSRRLPARVPHAVLHWMTVLFAGLLPRRPHRGAGPAPVKH